MTNSSHCYKLRIFDGNKLPSLSGCIVLAWVSLPLLNLNPAILSVFPGTEKLFKSHGETKSPTNSNMLHIFNDNTYTASEEPKNTS